jgi:three-Cys-motif partner protein
MPTLTQQGLHGRVLIIDGFCGPGEYQGGEEGSPIVALRTYLEHASRQRMTSKFVFLFIDKKKDRITHLEEVAIPRLGELPSNVEVVCHHGSFDESMVSILDDLQQRGKHMAPAFAFVDPFGFSDTPMNIIHRILEHPRSEVLITVMVDRIRQFLGHPEEAIRDRWHELFGDEGWQDLLDAPNRLQAIGDFYAERLSEAVKYVWSFRMLNPNDRPIYDLFFGTNHLDGLRKMKAAMWSVDPSGGQHFSDRNQDDPTLFGGNVDTSSLRKGFVSEFAGQTVSIEDLESWVLTETPFHAGHIKERTLKGMENDGLIEGIPAAWKNGRRKGTFPAGTRIRFL